VEVAALFLDKGSGIVSAEGRSFPLVKYASATKPLLDPRTRLIVLTNGGSASASGWLWHILVTLILTFYSIIIAVSG
jgi:C-terminal processing protease CtpA/Prc